MNKRTKLQYFIIAAVLSIAVVSVSVYSCEKQNFSPNTDEAVADLPDRFISEPGAICGEIVEKRIMKDASGDIGEALIYNDAKYFYVLLTAKRGHYMKDAFMHVCDRYSEFPLDRNGSPSLFMFEYKIKNQPVSSVRKFRIPISEISGNNYVAVAVEFNNTGNNNQEYKLAWIDGKFLGTEQPGRSFTFTKVNCLTTPGESDSADE